MLCLASLSVEIYLQRLPYRPGGFDEQCTIHIRKQSESRAQESFKRFQIQTEKRAFPPLLPAAGALLPIQVFIIIGDTREHSILTYNSPSII